MKRFILLTAVTLFGGCSSSPRPGTPGFAAAAAQQRYDSQVLQVKTTASELPDWYVNPPKDEHSLYAAGTADSSDLGFAFDKAILSAKRSLADRMNGALSSEHKEYLQENVTGAQPVQMSDRATTNRITDVVLNGYTVVHTKLVPTDTRYRVYVLLQYPLSNAGPEPNKQVARDSMQDTKLKAAKAFEDLQREIDAAKTRGDATKDGIPQPQP
jgi:hypothetical protein